MSKAPRPEAPTFQEIILRLQRYWADNGCVVMQPYDNEVGAGTFHTATTLRSLGPDAWRSCYVQPCFVEDDWESPTLGAWGLGCEVWIDGMEVTQFTYFQQVGGFECDPVPSEVTYGLERLAMYVQGVDSVYDIVWSRGDDGLEFTYGDVFLENEREFSAYNFEVADTDMLFGEFDRYEAECNRVLAAGLPLPAYDYVLKCSHAFNLLDARGVISATERMGYILRVRTIDKACCASYLEHVVGVKPAEEGEEA